MCHTTNLCEEEFAVIFGKHINRYYLKYGWLLLLGLASLVMVDYLQLEIPRLYQMVVNGVSTGQVELDGVIHTFDLAFLLDRSIKNRASSQEDARFKLSRFLISFSGNHTRCSK